MADTGRFERDAKMRAACKSSTGVIARKGVCGYFHRPHPEERALARVSKDGGESNALRPSFETLASQAPQDEVNDGQPTPLSKGRHVLANTIEAT
jgi:hypothetical protein